MQQRSAHQLLGRPQPGEYAGYAQADIDLVEGEDILRILDRQMLETQRLLAPVGDKRAATLTYAPGKWTLKQVVGHLSDDERIFAYRALCIARNDPKPLPGFEEKDYVRFGAFETRRFEELLDELRVVREATMAFVRGLTQEAWLRTGEVNGYPASARGLVFHIAGHELHHLRIVRERYLTA
jgi:uncharacterized damage-inducible protein DinB